MHSEILLVFCTCPDESTASRIADSLVGEGLAACVNLLPGVRSVYLWQGEIQRDPEVLLLIKTATQRLDALSARIRELHPYDLPEIIAIPVTAGIAEYLDWVRQCTSTET